MLATKNLVSISHHIVHYPFHPSPQPLPSGNHYCVLGIYVFIVSFLFIYFPHMSEIIWHLIFSIWVIWLSIIPSRSIHVVSNGKISSFFISHLPLLIVSQPHWSLFHSSYSQNSFFFILHISCSFCSECSFPSLGSGRLALTFHTSASKAFTDP